MESCWYDSVLSVGLFKLFNAIYHDQHLASWCTVRVRVCVCVYMFCDGFCCLMSDYSMMCVFVSAHVACKCQHVYYNQKPTDACMIHV